MPAPVYYYLFIYKHLFIIITVYFSVCARDHKYTLPLGKTSVSSQHDWIGYYKSEIEKKYLRSVPESVLNRHSIFIQLIDKLMRLISTHFIISVKV